MSKVYENDLSVFFSPNDFADYAIYTVSGGSAKTITGLYMNEFEASALFGEDASNSKPVFICQTADVASATNNDTLKIGTTTFYIMDVHPDKTGVTTLILSQDNVD